ncbi:MAG: prepilin peptidase [Proteobacteria bacterium]|nr:prepilin peptidase [Pseudomonadota bacterium]
MLYALSGFVFGLFIPYTARRFAKFMPASFAFALWQIVKPSKNARRILKSPVYKTYLWRALLSGLLTAALSYLFYDRFGVENICVKLAFLWILLLLAEIDWRIFLLPDLLTIPLLILGFFAAAWNIGFTIAPDSALGAAAGYFLPSLAALALVWKNRDAFGGGDIKLLAAIGAWLGLEGLLYTIALASAGQLVIALLRRQKAIAFGPALAFAAIIIAICFF